MDCRMVLQSFFILCLLSAAQSARPCTSFKFPPSNGSVESPGYPEVKTRYGCRRWLRFPPGGGFIIVNVTDIQLFYNNYDQEKQCSMSFTFGNYAAPCFQTENPCIAYYNSDKCSKAAEILQPRCKVYKTSETAVKIRVGSNGDGIDNWFASDSYPKGVKLGYKYLPCPAETKTTTAMTTSTIRHIITTTEPTITTASTTSTMKQTISQVITSAEAQNATMERGTTIKDLEDSSSATKAYPNSTFADFREMDDGSDYTAPAIAVCSVLIFLLMLATVVVLVLRRRNQSRSKQEVQDNISRDFDAVGSAETVYSVAYGNFAYEQSIEATHPGEQDEYASIDDLNQSEITAYATLDLDAVNGQSYDRNQGSAQSQDANSYSALQFDQVVDQIHRDNQESCTLVNQNVYSSLNVDPVVHKPQCRDLERIQSENMSGYSTLNLNAVANQSHHPNIEPNESDDSNAYSTLNHEFQIDQSNHLNTTTNQSEDQIYSTVRRESETVQTNARAKKLTVRYKPIL